MRHKSLILIWMSFSLLLAACAAKKDTQNAASAIEIQDAWARPAMMMDTGSGTSGDTSSSNGAAYLTIVNQGSAADRLTSAESDVAGSVQLHQSVMKDNVMSMSPVDTIDVPAKGQVELKPGGYHIMLVGLKQDLKIGDQIQLTLVFEKAGRVQVTADVKNP